MSAKRAERREDLRDRLLKAATARIEAGGLEGLRARDVTADAGCALGALYNAFADLDELIMHVNSATLKPLEASVAEVVRRRADPGETLKALALGYLAFARENSRSGGRSSSIGCPRCQRPAVAACRARGPHRAHRRAALGSQS